MKKIHSQKGSLLIPMIFLIVAVSALVTTVVYLTINQSTGITNENKRLDAFYTAKAGAERATYALLTYNLSDQVSCANIATNFSNISFGDGRFSVTGTLYQPTSATLSAAITNSSTVIPVNSVNGYAPQGSITIDAEVIRYNQVASSTSSCNGYAACFLGGLRGQLTTSAVSHAVNALAVQKQCTLSSQGGVPNLTNPVALQVVTAGVQLEAQSAGDGWVVASKHANGNETTIYYNGTSWALKGPYNFVPNKNLNGVFTLPNKSAWLVGESGAGTVPVILYYDSQNLSIVTPDSALNQKDLYAVTCVTSSDCWVTGTAAAIGHWNGTSWTQSSLSGNVPSVTYYAATCTNTSNCWAVGGLSGGLASIIRWNGSTWSKVTPDNSTNQTLYGLVCLSASNCWAVGGSSLITHWDGASWAKATGGYIGATVPAAVTLKGITCVDTTHCWAVGSADSNKGTILFFNGTVWQRAADDGSLPNQQYNSVSCNNVNSCWTVGTSRAVAYFNGSVWSNFISDPSVPTVDLNGVSMTKKGYTATGVGKVVYVQAS